MSEIKKTVDQISREATEMYNEFQSDFKVVRDYLSKNSIVKETYGGISIDLGNHGYSRASIKSNNGTPQLLKL